MKWMMVGMKNFKNLVLMPIVLKKLRMEGHKLRTDYSVINYAKENNMILVTRDTESGQACEENNLPYVLLDNNSIFNIVLNKLKNY